MAGGSVASAVFHPGGSIAVLIDNLRRNDLLGRVTSIVRGDLLEVPLARRYGMIFCDAVHGEIEAARTMPKIAELAADECLLIFDDVTTEAFADVICGYLKPTRRFLLSSKDRYGKLLVVEHRATRAAAAPARPKPRLATPPDAAAARQTVATELWRNAFRERGIERSVLIASTFRSGSTYVSELLDRNGLPGLGAERFANSWRLAATPPGEAFSAFLGETLAEAQAGCFATKLMWPHMARLAEAMGHGRDDAAALAGLFAPAHWIQVARADKFDQAVSFWRAKTSGRWHVYARDKEPEPTVEYDFLAIWDALHEIALHDRLWDDFFSRAGITPIRVTYEEIEADPAGGMARLLARLGLPAEAPTTEVPLRRQRDAHSAALRDRFVADLYRV
jgi:LPS sulfotransferase NodH